MYFSGQGKLYYAVRDDNGNPGPFAYAGNVPALSVKLTTDTIEHNESTSGQRLLDFRLVKGKKAEIDFSLEEFTLDNLATGLYGTKLAATTGTSVTGEALGTPKAGQYTPLAFPNVSSVVIGSLVLGTDYTLNAQMGMVFWLTDQDSATTANYTYASNGGSVTMFTQAAPERWFRFEGLNTASENKPVIVELYRTIVDPMKQMDLINDALLKMDLTGAALYDAQRGADAAFGNFGRVTFLS